MGIRVQPREIEIPQQDPFLNDLLNRRESVEILATLIGSIDGPCVIGIDAAWGNGKTTFLGMLYQYLVNQRFPVATFNAWTSDYSSDPFVAVSTELTDAIRAHVDESAKEVLEHAVERTKEVLKHMAPGVLKTLLASVPFGQVAGEVLDAALASYADDRVAAYKEAKNAVEAFQESLGEMAKAASKSPDNRPLVLLIDELDRCRPSYAVELLEVAKHLFSVDGIVFVLAVNRSELAHSVQALYGGGFDALGYLDRFFDVDYRLPELDRKDFINASIRSVGIPDYLQRTRDREGPHAVSMLEELFGVFFGESSVSLRTVARAIHHLGLVYAALPDNQRIFADTSAVLMILRTISRQWYYRLIEGEASDLEVVDNVYTNLGIDVIKGHEHAVCLFDAWIILAHQQFSLGDALITGTADPTPLQLRYEAIVAEDDSRGGRPQSPKVKRADGALRIVRDIGRNSTFVRGFPIKAIVQRIELISAEYKNINSED